MKRGEVTPGTATALVTGAGRGLGRQYAEQLARMGYNLILVGKSSTVETAAAEIVSEGLGVSVRAIVKDLSVRDAADELFDEVSGTRIDVLVNNAGMFSFRDITLTDEKVLEDMLTLHDMTLAKLNRLFAADMVKKGGGHILNMSSYSIWMPLPGLALYGGSKAFVRAFSIAFSKEVREKGVYVTAICPAGIATDLYGLSRDFQKLGIRCGVLMTPERCAKRALKVLFSHRRSSVPDWWNCLFIPVLKHLPDWAETALRKKTLKYQK